MSFIAIAKVYDSPRKDPTATSPSAPLNCAGLQVLDFTSAPLLIEMPPVDTTSSAFSAWTALPTSTLPASYPTAVAPGDADSLVSGTWCRWGDLYDRIVATLGRLPSTVGAAGWVSGILGANTRGFFLQCYYTDGTYDPIYQQGNNANAVIFVGETWGDGELPRKVLGFGQMTYYNLSGGFYAFAQNTANWFVYYATGFTADFFFSTYGTTAGGRRPSNLAFLGGGVWAKYAPAFGFNYPLFLQDSDREFFPEAGGGTVAFPTIDNYLDYTKLGMISVFAPTSSEIAELTNKLWTTNIWELFQKFFNDPMDYLVNMSIVPFRQVDIAPTATGTFGFTILGGTSGITMHLLQRSQTIYDCGTITVQPQFGGFLDYSPYTSIGIFIPYHGYEELDPNDVMGQQLTLRLYMDVANGVGVAMLGVGSAGDENVIAQYPIQFARQYPLTSGNYTEFVRAMGDLAAAGISQALDQSDTVRDLGNIAGAAAGAVSSLVSGPAISCRGGLSPNAFQLGIQYPYLIVKRPILAYEQSEAAEMAGMPAGDVKPALVGDFTGFVSATRVWFDAGRRNISERERQEIEEMLVSGVIV